MVSLDDAAMIVPAVDVLGLNSLQKPSATYDVG